MCYIQNPKVLPSTVFLTFFFSIKLDVGLDFICYIECHSMTWISGSIKLHLHGRFLNLYWIYFPLLVHLPINNINNVLDETDDLGSVQKVKLPWEVIIAHNKNINVYCCDVNYFSWSFQTGVKNNVSQIGTCMYQALLIFSVKETPLTHLLPSYLY